MDQSINREIYMSTYLDLFIIEKQSMTASPPKFLGIGFFTSSLPLSSTILQPASKVSRIFRSTSVVKIRSYLVNLGNCLPKIHDNKPWHFTKSKAAGCILAAPMNTSLIFSCNIKKYMFESKFNTRYILTVL